MQSRRIKHKQFPALTHKKTFKTIFDFCDNYECSYTKSDFF